MADDMQGQLPTPDPALRRLDRFADRLRPRDRDLPVDVYANIGPMPLPYRWEVEGDTLKISVSYGPMDATFTGSFYDDGQSFGGSWRPNPEANETVNVPYDIGGRRLA